MSENDLYIDLDADPVVADDDWTVEEHQKNGKLRWAADRVLLFVCSGQKDCQMIHGDVLRNELASKPVFNANLLDYLLDHPHLIPDEWKGKYVFFWGTIYRCPRFGLFVRCLFWRARGWRWDCLWFDGSWSGDFPAAVLAT